MRNSFCRFIANFSKKICETKWQPTFALYAYDIVLADSDICAVRKRYSRIARVILRLCRSFGLFEFFVAVRRVRAPYSPIRLNFHKAQNHKIGYLYNYVVFFLANTRFFCYYDL